MKRSYTIRLFLVALGLFWLGLMLTAGLRTSASRSDLIALDYKQLEGIESIHFDSNLMEETASSRINSLKVTYADQPHITVEFDGIEDKNVVSNLFTRDGNRLIFSPKIRQKESDASSPNDDAMPYHTGWWDIKKIRLPLHLQHLKTRGINLEILNEQELIDLHENTYNDQPQTDEIVISHLPQLDIESEVDFIGIGMHIGTLRIRQHADYVVYPSGTGCSLSNSGRITIFSSSKIGELSIESRGGDSIKLDNTADIQKMTLRTTPDTNIELDRIDAFQRIHWTPLPALEVPKACHTPAEMPASAAASAMAAASASAAAAQ